ncbi:putative phthalate transporter [Sphingobium herbicidovorans NBRC 16415]|uniref:Phthalate transporter n=1 Tax=Sphingobium herbicidovorans (strain ATCC 700291 / DSM 11019 / CCUG 56400 / KCTC 2939 / LMG 18315 / NBRC 16415 / MH) TaxID=1219045 RepID=A0A086PBW4_SPHHM|nr:MFS transporter [Sphingobium herbicidovorans]KFG90882.1 putative phthalate transporter [Sphingobium herbicidovorans NBRC 16415]
MIPGVLFFVSAWFPATVRARANSLFLAAAPIGIVFGALLAGPILQMDGMLGLQGWQWLFLLEGAPTVLLGIVAYFLLVDTPDQARWLTSDEKQAIKTSLERSKPVQPHAKGTWRSAITKNVLVLAAIIYCNQTSTSILASWTPLIVKDAVHSGYDLLLISLLSALPALTAIISMFVTGALSDRHAERFLYAAGALMMAAIGWGVCLLAPTPSLKIVGLCIAAGGAFGALVPFWALVPEMIGREGRAVAVATITSLATIASVATPCQSAPDIHPG